MGLTKSVILRPDDPRLVYGMLCERVISTERGGAAMEIYHDPEKECLKEFICKKAAFKPIIIIPSVILAFMAAYGVVNAARGAFFSGSVLIGVSVLSAVVFIITVITLDARLLLCEKNIVRVCRVATAVLSEERIPYEDILEINKSKQMVTIAAKNKVGITFISDEKNVVKEFAALLEKQRNAHSINSTSKEMLHPPLPVFKPLINSQLTAEQRFITGFVSNHNKANLYFEDNAPEAQTHISLLAIERNNVARF
jgi:hypothetical protein